MPKINDNGTLKLINARHPLLKVKKVIPNNVNFSRNYDGIIITGPNTGGKTVLLKTIGLLSLMTKYGLLIPADTASDVMIYDNVYCDIGDDQSIENNRFDKRNFGGGATGNGKPHTVISGRDSLWVQTNPPDTGSDVFVHRNPGNIDFLLGVIRGWFAVVYG